MIPCSGLIHQTEVDLILKWLTIETDISPGVANLSFLKKIWKSLCQFLQTGKLGFTKFNQMILKSIPCKSMFNAKWFVPFYQFSFEE